MLNRFKIAVVFINIGVSHWLAPSTILYAQYVDTIHVTDTQYEYTYAYDWNHTHLTSVSELRDSNTNMYNWSYLQFKQYDDNFNVIRETRYNDSKNFLQEGALPITNLHIVFLALSLILQQIL